MVNVADSPDIAYSGTSGNVNSNAGQLRRVAALKARRSSRSSGDTTTTNSNTPPITAPTTSNTRGGPSSSVISSARRTWDSYDYDKQQEFMSNNSNFDSNKYGFTVKNAPDNGGIPEGTHGAPTNYYGNPEEDDGGYDYSTDDPGRLQEIQSNLSDYYQEQPEIFNDRETFDNFFHTSERSQAQRDVLNNFYNNRSGESTIYSLPNGTIATGLVDGTYTDADLNALRISDPSRWVDIMTMKQREQDRITNNNTLASMAEQSGFDMFRDTMGYKDEDENGIFDMFEPEDTQEVIDFKNRAVELDTQLKRWDVELNTIEDDYIDKYPGVPKGKISSLVRDASNDIIQSKNDAILELNTLNGYIKNANDAQQMQIEGAKASMTSFGQMYGIYLRTPEGIAETAAAEYAAEHLDMDAGTPAQQKAGLNQALDQYYKDFGIIIERPQSAVVDDVMSLAARTGMRMSEALKVNFVDQLRDKDEYKVMLQTALGINAQPIEIAGSLYQQDETGNRNLRSPTRNVDITSAMSYSDPAGLGDLSDSTLVNENPNEASFKNNNPTGIKFRMSDDLKEKIAGAGINISEGTISPEGGAYAKFDTMEDGLRAYKVAFTEAGSDDVKQRLKIWKTVGDTEAYAKKIMREAGISKGAKFSSLSPEELNKLMDVHLKRESGALHKYMKSLSLKGQIGGLIPTAAELAMFKKGAQYIGKENGLTAQRYNEISEFQNSKEGSSVKYSADDMEYVTMPIGSSAGALNSLGFGNRMYKVLENIDEHEDIFIEKDAAGQVWDSNTANVLKSNEQKQYELYKENWITASLRKESGAAISDSEFDTEEKKYFAMPGDNEETVAMKREMREFATRQMYVMAGADANGVAVVSYFKGIKRGVAGVPFVDMGSVYSSLGVPTTTNEEDFSDLPD